MGKDLFDSNTAMYVLGYLMTEPQIINRESCLLTLNDFTKPLYQTIFGAINNLAIQGANKIYPQDIDVYLGQYNEQYKIFTEGQGLEFLKNLQAMEFNDEAQFYVHYEKLKKFTVLRDLEKNNIDTTEFYDPSDLFQLEKESKKLDSMSIPQILDRIRLKLAKIEKVNFNKDGNYFQSAADGIFDLLEKLKREPDVGYPLEGEILNYISRGGRRGKMYLYSAGSGNGKTRFFVGQACFRAYPRIVGNKVIVPSELEKVYFVSTEQEPEEIQKMILACISGVNQEKINYSNLATPEEAEKIMMAAHIMEKYRDNFFIDRIPEPSISKVRTSIIEKILDRDIDMVVYDYIAIPEDDDGMATKRQLRSDQVLMQFSNTLKEIAVSYNIFMLSGTQITGGDLTKKMVRGFADIRDGKSIADKADIAMIGCFVTDEEYKFIETYCKELHMEKPNYVLDIFKNRDGSITNCKIYRNFDLGTLRSQDMLITSQSFKLINNYSTIKYGSQQTVDMVDFLTRGGSEC